MSPETKKQALKIYDESRAAVDRDSYLKDACGGDTELQREVASLVAVEEDSKDFLEEPLLPLAQQPTSEFKKGDVVGQYRILYQLAEGGMGTVYRAVRDEPGFSLQAAIKVIRPGKDGEEVVSRFLQEHAFLARLDHPNIAKPFDRGRTETGHPYLVMEYVEGDRIDRYCDTHQLSTRQRLELFKKVCSAVHFAHQNLVVHRDLKPANILVTWQGEPKLLDFGIARLVEPSPFSTNAETLRQTTGGFLGTLRYASPEQVRNDDLISTASDIYSLGMLLYELLTGHYPFQKWNHSFLDLVNAICEEEPDKPSTAIGLHEEIRCSDGSQTTLTPEEVSESRGDKPRHLQRRLSGDLDNIVLKALAKRPEDRYASAQDLADDIDRHLAGLPVDAREPTFAYQLGKFFRRHTGQVATAAGMILMIVAFAFTALWLWQREQEARKKTEQALFVSDYLVDAFGVRNPGNEGASITAKDLLDDAIEDLETRVSPAELSKETDERLRSQLPSDLPGLMHAFGWAYFGLGAYGEAETWLQRSLSLRSDSTSSPEIGDLVLTKLHLSATLSALDHDEEASRLRTEAWKNLGRGSSGDLRLAKRLNELAILLEDRGDLEGAVEVSREAVAMKRRLLSGNDASIAIALTNLGGTLENLGRYDEAEAAYRESLDIKQDLYPDDAQALEKVQNNLAALLREQGLRQPDRQDQLWTESEELFRKSLATRRASYSGEDPRVATVLNNLALLLIYRGKLTEAEPLSDEALAVFRKLYGDDDFAVGVVLRNRATLEQAAGNPDDGERAARRAMVIFEKALGPDHWRTADARSVLGACLLDLNRVGDAEPLLRDSLPILEAELGKDARATWEARQRLQRYQSLASGEAPSTGD